MRLSYWCIISLISIPIKANTMNESNLIGQPYPIILNPHGGGGSAKPAANAEYHVGEIGKDPVQYPRTDIAYKDEETGEERLITSPIYTNNSGAFVASKNSGTIITPYMKNGLGYSVLIKGRRGKIYESKAAGDPGNIDDALKEKLPNYTDIVYKSLSDMLSENPLKAKVGNICRADGLEYKRVKESEPALIGDFELISNDVGIIRASYRIKAGEDFTSNFQDAVNDPETKKVIIDIPCKISSKVTMPDEMTIEWLETMTCTGDEDFYIFSADNTSLTLINPKLKDSTNFEDRTKLHRMIRTERMKIVRMTTPNIEGANTAIDDIDSEWLIVDGTIYLKNIYGSDPQSGYGVNTSAKRTFIGPISWNNKEIGSSHGRHVLYINGDARHLYCPHIDCKTMQFTPVNVRIKDTTDEGNINIDSLVLDGVNIGVISSEGGCVNFSKVDDKAPEFIKVRIGHIDIKNFRGKIFSAPNGGYRNLELESVTARNYLGNPSGDTNTYHPVECAGVRNPHIGDVRYNAKLPTNQSVAVEFDNCITPKLDSVNTFSTTDGRAAIRFNNCQGTSSVDKIITALPVDIERLNNIGQVIYDRAYDVTPVEITSITPSVSRLTQLYLPSSGNITITDLVNGYESQKVTITNRGGTLKIKHGSGMFNYSGSDLTLPPRGAVTYIRSGSSWYQMG